MTPPIDSFGQGEQAAVAVTVKRVEVILTIDDAVPASGENPGTPAQYTARYAFDRLAADGSIAGQPRQGNLVPYLTAQQITSIKAFMDQMLAKAKTTV